MPTRRLSLLLALAIFAGCAVSPGVRVEKDVAVPMRDGVMLRADVYRPSRGGPFPVLVFRTPYGKHFAAKSDGVHLKAVERGYAVVMQDVRGRYASGGIFDPYRQERHDGYDTIEWAAAQRWSNGRVGTSDFRIPGQCSGSPRFRPSALAVHGPGDDVLVAAPVLLHERTLRSARAAVDLPVRGARRAASTRHAGRGRRRRRPGRRSPASSSPSCRCGTCRGCARKRRISSSGWRIRPKIRGGTGRRSAAATAACRPQC